MKKKILLCILALLLILCVLVACHDTPPAGNGGNDASQGGGTTDGGTTPPPADPVPVHMETLNGKTAEALYEDVEAYFSSLMNCTLNAGMKMTLAQGESRVVTNSKFLYKISGESTYNKTETETLGSTTVTEETVIGGFVYVNDGESKIMYAAEDYEDSGFGGNSVPLDESIHSIAIYEFEGKHYLLMDFDEAKINEMLASAEIAGAQVSFEEISCRIDLTSEQDFASMTLTAKGSTTIDGVLSTYDISMNFAISDIGRTAVIIPADVAEYELYIPDFDWGGDGDGGDEQLVTILFDTDGYGTVAPIVEYAGTPISSPTAPVKPNYTFIGWYTEDGDAYTFTVMPEEDLVLYARYRRQLCTINFITNGGSAVSPITLAPGTSVTAPTDPTKPFSTFLGWVTADNKPYTFTVMPEDDLVLYARFQDKSSIVITFKYVDMYGNPMRYLSDGSTEYRRTVYKGSSWVYGPAVVDDTEAFADYVITGWDTDGDGVADELWRTATNDITVVSVVRKKVFFSVKFYREDGTTLYKDIRMKEGTGVDDYEVGKPVEAGKYFKNWIKVSGESSTALIEDECVFKASYGISDGTIGRVAPGTIKVDGIKEPAYATDGTGSGAYLPVNTMQQADHVPWQGYNGTNTDDIENGGHRGVPTVDVDASLVWDGEYIYLFVEVYEKTLVGRSSTYTMMVADAYLNDTVEVWYYFEQKATGTGNNYTRLSVGGVRCYNDLAEQYETLRYASPRSYGIGGGRSTHFDETLVAVRSALDTYDDPTFDGVFDPEGKTKPSYHVEIAFPAYTEGKADTSVWGIDTATGRKPGTPVSSNFPEGYAFTSGQKLVAGDFVRFNIQINDLLFSQFDISGLPGSKFADCPGGVVGERYYLFYVDDQGNLLTDPDTGKPIEVQGSDDAMFGSFSAVGHTQMDTNYYIMFTLGDTEQAQTKIWGLSGKANNRKFYADKSCSVTYTRPVN
ncbi:MAG: InlB B-repeat-containing protein [Clostridia bacterium]|nr:InlB B-repeat-containing protein [Clostridia bacterium]